MDASRQPSKRVHKFNDYIINNYLKFLINEAFNCIL